MCLQVEVPSSLHGNSSVYHHAMLRIVVVLWVGVLCSDRVEPCMMALPNDDDDYLR